MGQHICLGDGGAKGYSGRMERDYYPIIQGREGHSARTEPARALGRCGCRWEQFNAADREFEIERGRREGKCKGCLARFFLSFFLFRTFG